MPEDECLLDVLLRTRVSSAAPKQRRRRSKAKAKPKPPKEEPPRVPSLFANPTPWESPRGMAAPRPLDPYAPPFVPTGYTGARLHPIAPPPPQRRDETPPPLSRRPSPPWRSGGGLLPGILEEEGLVVTGSRRRPPPPHPLRETMLSPPHHVYRGGEETPPRAASAFEEKQVSVEKFVEQYVSSTDELDHLTQLDDGSLSLLLEAADRLQEYRQEENEKGATLGVSAPLRYRVMCSSLPEETKHRILQQLDGSKGGSILGGGGQDAKYRQWVESALRLPLGRLSSFDGEEGPVARMLRVAKDLEKSVYGHTTTKHDLLQRMVNGSPPAPLLLCGPPGVGKTRIARQVLATAMGKPFIEIPMGGATNADFLRGSLYVYEGSGPGRLAQGLQSVRVMNPVVFMDEIDKISQTPHGQEIAAVLIQLVDGTQNSGFEDKYFPGIKLDVSQIQFVFAANDLERIDPILRDRLDVIQIAGYTREEKRAILERTCSPKSPGRWASARATSRSEAAPSTPSSAGSTRKRA